MKRKSHVISNEDLYRQLYIINNNLKKQLEYERKKEENDKKRDTYNKKVIDQILKIESVVFGFIIFTSIMIAFSSKDYLNLLVAGLSVFSFFISILSAFKK